MTIRLSPGDLLNRNGVHYVFVHRQSGEYAFKDPMTDNLLLLSRRDVLNSYLVGNLTLMLSNAATREHTGDRNDRFDHVSNC